MMSAVRFLFFFFAVFNFHLCRVAFFLHLVLSLFFLPCRGGNRRYCYRLSSFFPLLLRLWSSRLLSFFFSGRFLGYRCSLIGFFPVRRFAFYWLMTVGAEMLVAEKHFSASCAFVDVPCYFHSATRAYWRPVAYLVSTFWTFYYCHCYVNVKSL